MFIALFIFILLVIGILFSSITVRFNWRGNARWAALSYTFVDFRIDFNDLTGRLKIGPFSFKSFDLRKSEEKPKKESIGEKNKV